ncbi:YheT family hydrolase [Edaphobacter dinghuensis]|uniref:Alpha/beta hydrolase n=1 Tax=Edaphobacter dinghuensis TaxID=1560005 RepID=A0A917MBC9_9BACT|nr:alpha/beta fold hydrolase [Edaphobacter dinghuensis]GGG89281.1 alpha/beta hydrolase [Edaphobacter dinghuensis]
MSTTTFATDTVLTADFQPRRYLRNGHLQTIFGNYLPRANSLPAPEAQLVEVSPATDYQISSQVLCHCHWQPEDVRATRPTAIIVHGLEGSSNSQYVIGNANKLWHAGCNVVRMNMRNCGGTEALAPTLYHSGLSGDVDAVMRFFVELHHLQSITLIGYSMGGNLVLKLAGELGKNPPPELHAVIGVSPVIDLAPSSAALHLWQNRVYEKKFVRAMLRRFRRKASLFPRAFDPNRATGVSSLRDFDEHIISLYAGFANADDYYHRVAAARVIDQITVPTLILNSLDDPFIRIAPDTRDKIVANPNITFLETAQGGHCAFLAQPDPTTGYDGYWAEHTLLRFILANA